MKENVILSKSRDFALNSVELYKDLLSNREYILSKQYFRSATSIGANVNEATAGYSKKDFASKYLNKIQTLSTRIDKPE